MTDTQDPQYENALQRDERIRQEHKQRQKAKQKEIKQQLRAEKQRAKDEHRQEKERNLWALIQPGSALDHDL